MSRSANQPPGAPYGGCILRGISLSGGRYLANLGSILVAGIAILTVCFLLWRSERKAAAVGRREIQLFLLGFMVIMICEIFTVGGFPLDDNVRRGFTCVQIAAITTTTWWLFLNALVGYQLLEDGTPLSMALMVVSGAIFFIGTGYIALDTAFDFTGYFINSWELPNHRNVWLYVLYQLFPLVCLFFFFVLEAGLVVFILNEVKPLIYLAGAALLFAIGQIFNYVISVHICDPTQGKINGAFFETLFTLASVIVVWLFWSSITEDDWSAQP